MVSRRIQESLTRLFIDGLYCVPVFFLVVKLSSQRQLRGRWFINSVEIPHHPCKLAACAETSSDGCPEFHCGTGQRGNGNEQIENHLRSGR